MILRTQSQTLRGSVTGVLNVYIAWKVYSSDGRFLSQGSFAEVLQSGPGFVLPAIIANNVIVPGDVNAIRELSIVVLANTEGDLAAPAVPFTIFVYTAESGRVVYSGSLKPGHEAHYYAGRGWSIYDAAGLLVTAPEGSAGGAPSTELSLPVIADPATPAADTLRVYAKAIGGRAMLAQVGPSGRDTSFQPNLGGNKCALWMPPGGATTVPGVFGMSALTATGTVTTRAVATTNIVTRMTRLGYVSAATAGALCGAREAAAKYTTGAGGGLGGFFLRWRFAPSNAATVAGARMFLGMWAQTTAPTNLEPSGLLNHVGVAQLSTSDNLHIVASQGAAPITAIDLGSDFPANLNSVAYELVLFAPPAGGVYYEVSRLNHPAVATGVLAAGDVPLGTQLLCLQSWRTNNATALAVGLDLCGIYIENDF